MSTMCRQSVRSLAFLQAEWIPMLTNCTSELIPLSQVERGRPQDLLRRLNNPMVILLKVSMCHMPKEAEPSLSVSKGHSFYISSSYVKNWSPSGYLA